MEAAHIVEQFNNKSDSVILAEKTQADARPEWLRDRK